MELVSDTGGDILPILIHLTKETLMAVLLVDKDVILTK
jgi:hypothetical protein